MPFKDVLAAMHGALFPEARGEACEGSDLLAALLAPREEPSVPKPAAKPTAQASTAACPACTSASASTASSRTASTALSRTSSWLSFASRSARSSTSASTALTTPATSPVSSWLKSAPPPLPRAKASPLRHSHACAAACTTRPTPVDLADCPLSFAPPRAQCAEAAVPAPVPAPSTRSAAGGTLSWVAELARAVHSAALFSVTVAAAYEPPRAPSPLQAAPRKTLRPAGSRVCAADVRTLTAPDPAARAPATAALFIPLVCPFPPPPAAASASTPTAQQLTKSPYKPAAPPAQLAYRMRPVGNPVFLRLRALQNVVGGAPGGGGANALGCGRERVVGVAWEGRRRSGLGCEVRVGVF